MLVLNLNFLNISKEDYDSISWTECIKYLEGDLISLYQVLIGQIVNHRFKVDFTKSLSISSLSLKIFKTNYLKSNKILTLLRGLESLIFC